MSTGTNGNLRSNQELQTVDIAVEKLRREDEKSNDPFAQDQAMIEELQHKLEQVGQENQ